MFGSSGATLVVHTPSSSLVSGTGGRGPIQFPDSCTSEAFGAQIQPVGSESEPQGESRDQLLRLAPLLLFTVGTHPTSSRETQCGSLHILLCVHELQKPASMPRMDSVIAISVIVFPVSNEALWKMRSTERAPVGSATPINT